MQPTYPFSTNIYVSRKGLEDQLSQNFPHIAKGSLVFISGENSVGKTTFVQHTCTPFKQKGQFLSSTYNSFLPTGSQASAGYEAFTNILADFLAREERNKQLLELLKEFAPDLLATIPLPGIPFAVLGVKFAFHLLGKDNRGFFNHGNVSQSDKLQEKYIKAIRSIAKHHPLILHIDNAHLMDPSSADLLYKLSEQINNLPILLITSYDKESWKNSPHYHLYKALKDKCTLKTLDVHWFTKKEIAQYLCLLFPHAGYSESSPLIHWLHETWNGNPGLTAEAVKLLIEKNWLDSEGRLLVKHLDQESFPENAEQLIKKRIDALSDELRVVLSYAGILGDEFTNVVLQDLISKFSNKQYATHTLAQQLEILQSSQRLIQWIGRKSRSSRPADAYRFTVAAFRKYIIKTMDPTVLRNAQDALFSILENEYEHAANPGEKVVLCTQLIDLGRITENYNKVTEYALELSQTAIKRYSANEAKKNCEIGLEALDKVKAQQGMTKDLSLLEMNFNLVQARAYDISSSRKKAIEMYTSVVEKARMLGARLEEARAHNRLGYLYWWSHHGPNNVLREFEAAYKLTEGMTDPAGLAEKASALNGLAFIYGRKAKTHSKARQANQEALKIYQDLGDMDGIATCYNNLGTLEEDPQVQLDYYLKSINLSKEYNLAPYERGNPSANAGWIYLTLKDFQNAKTMFEEAIEVQEDVDDSHIAYAYRGLAVTLTWIQQSKSNFEQAMNLLERAVTAARNNNDQEEAFFCLYELSKIARCLENYNKVIETSMECLELLPDISLSNGTKRNLFSNLYLGLIDAFHRIGDLKMAVEFSQLYQSNQEES